MRFARVLARGAFAVITAIAVLPTLHGATRAQTPPPWTVSGADIHNSRASLSPTGPNQLRSGNAAQLREKWEFTTAGDVSATPTVEQGGLYITDWGGMIYKLDPATGVVIWSHAITDYTGDPNSKSRGSPAISGNTLIFGDLSIARVIAVDKNTGNLLWRRTVDGNSDSTLTSSATVYNGVAYVGVASREENSIHSPPASFRGRVVALDVQTGGIRWQFMTAPPGYTGNAVVAAPVVDEMNQSLYVVTDNNYTIPDSVESCVDAQGTDMAAQIGCFDPANYVDAALALDLNTGALKWSRLFQGADTWTSACNTGAGCAQPPGLDFDFAGSPNLFRVPDFIGVNDDRGGQSNIWILGIGQKSGYYRALNPLNGGVFWSTLVGLGGIQWGSAVDLDDKNRFYVAIKNDAHKTNMLKALNGTVTPWNGGSWSALDAHNGNFIWQIPASGKDLANPKYNASAPGPLTFSNYLVFGGSSSGEFVVMSATSGRILWKFQTGGTVISGPAIYNDWVYWGTGYAHLGGVGKHTLYAFSVN